MREWLELRDFSQGMNQEDAITAGNGPWYLQDVLLSEKPELRRRGAYERRFPSLNYSNAKNWVLGYVVTAERFSFVGIDCVLVVSTDYEPTFTVGEYTVHGRTYISTIETDGTPTILKTINGYTTSAAIAGAWTDETEEKNEARPDAALITTNIGTWVLSFDNTYVSSSSNDTLGNAADFFTVARTYHDHGAIKGGGFKCCASVNGYSFLANRLEKDNGTNAAQAASRRIWYSKLQNSEKWKNKTDPDNPALGGSITIPITEQIRHLTELNGQLIIFTRRSIQSMSISADPGIWDRRERASVGTTFPGSIARYGDGLIFANKDGVYSFSGYETSSLTNASISQLYRDTFYEAQGMTTDEENPSENPITGIVWGDYYLLSMGDINGKALCCHLPTNSWVMFTNIYICAASGGTTNDYRIFGYIKDELTGARFSRIVRLDRMFEPDRGHTDSYQREGAAIGPTMKVELRRTVPTGLQTPKLWRSITVLYDAKNTTGTNNNLRLRYAASPDRDDAQWTEVTALPTTTSTTQERRTIAATSGAIGIQLEEFGRIGKTSIAAIELGYKELRRGRV